MAVLGLPCCAGSSPVVVHGSHCSGFPCCRAQTLGYAGFRGAQTPGYAGFRGAQTPGYVGFRGAQTLGYAGFRGAQTLGYAGFSVTAHGLTSCGSWL